MLGTCGLCAGLVACAGVLLGLLVWGTPNGGYRARPAVPGATLVLRDRPFRTPFDGTGAIAVARGGEPCLALLTPGIDRPSRLLVTAYPSGTTLLEAFVRAGEHEPDGQFVAVGDVDGDGFDELLVAGRVRHVEEGSTRHGTTNALGLLSARDGSWVRPWMPVDGDVRSCAGVGDLDGDGIADAALLVQMGDTGRVEVRSGRTLALIPFEGPGFFGTQAKRSDLLAVDLDGDGARELALVLAGGEPGALELWILGRDRSWRERLSIHPLEHAYSVELAALPDLDGDRIPEIAVGGERECLALSPRTGALVRTFRATVDRQPLAAGAGDFDGDGVQDLLVSECGGGDDLVRVLSGRDGGELLCCEDRWFRFANPRPVALGDVDGDGRAEIALFHPREDRSGYDLELWDMLYGASSWISVVAWDDPAR